MVNIIKYNKEVKQFGGDSMKGWLFSGTNIPLELIEKEDPKAIPDHVVIDVKAAGLCHSDVAALQDPGWTATFPKWSCYYGGIL